MSTPNDEAQRNLERKALRNVRALVDKIEATDENRDRSARRLAAVIVAVILGLFVIVYGVSQLRRGEPERTLVLPPPASANK
jgi:hypothetical protein